ncbi:hypothetical protein XU18_4790 [Perkinsela sp. CCAP 1560/4]|nr:hypothetical protein XU18_4790 [Perkinsela sp. CCAP 1560/4]|eukprot:KNH03901.1 hypothetical protein XU18_4790 [Perkinsela sp. CCAP 1560/4]
MTEPTLFAAYRKLLHSLHQVAESVDVIAEKQLDLRMLSLVLFSEAKVDLSDPPTDTIPYERCLHRTMSDAGTMQVAKVSGVSRIAGMEMESGRTKGKSNDRRGLKRIRIPHFPDVYWSFTYAEALRLVDPLLVRLCLPTHTLSRVRNRAHPIGLVQSRS